MENKIDSQAFSPVEKKQSKIFLDAVLANTPLFMMIVDSKGRVETMSSSLLRFAGHDPEEYKGLHGGEVLRCIHQLDDASGCGFGPMCKDCKVRQIILDTLTSGKSYHKIETELSMLDDSIEKRNFLLSTAAIEYPEKKAVVFVEDITKQKKIETVLTEQTDFLNALIETISNPIFYKDSHGCYTGCNKAFEMFIGKSRSDIIGKTIYDIGPEKLADKLNNKDLHLFNNPGKQRFEWRVETADGKTRDVIFNKATLHDLNGSVTGLVGVISDITERRHSEDLVRNLSQMLIQAQENERKMISCELHDSIAQNLSTLKLYCTRIFGDQSSLDDDIKAHLSDVAKLIDETVRNVRDLAYDLRPPSLDHLGLAHALEVFCEEFSDKNNIAVVFQTAGIQGLDLFSDTEINLYRLVQEGLNNIRKHAAATKAVIKLIGASSQISLGIEDNGKGFDVKKRELSMINEKRMGLWSMKERVNLLQGKMTIHSQLGKGTKIVIKLRLEDR